MSHVLLTFLGKARQSSVSGYERVAYAFEDGTVRSSAYFGVVLKDYLEPDRMVVLGTAGSTWDALIENIAPDTGDEEMRLTLIDAVGRGAVTRELLTSIEPLASRALGIPCTLDMIPYGRDEEQQTQTLAKMAEHLHGAHRATLDVTHSFRHLPMLALLSAMYLEKTQPVAIDAIYYGALDMRTGDLVPVINLSGLLHIARWLAMLDAFDKDGDYGVIAELLEKEGLPKAQVGLLRKAAYAERVFNHELANQNLRQFLPLLDNSLPGTGALFTATLRERLSWISKVSPAERLQAIARLALARADYARAAVAAQTAYVLVHARPDERISRYEVLGNIEEEIRDGRRGDALLRPAYEELKRLRNTLAHGTAPQDDATRRILADENRLRDALDRLFRQLLPE